MDLGGWFAYTGSGPRLTGTALEARVSMRTGVIVFGGVRDL
jgi:hypothetical protein